MRYFIIRGSQRSNVYFDKTKQGSPRIHNRNICWKYFELIECKTCFHTNHLSEILALIIWYEATLICDNRRNISNSLIYRLKLYNWGIKPEIYQKWGRFFFLSYVIFECPLLDKYFFDIFIMPVLCLSCWDILVMLRIETMYLRHSRTTKILLL